MVTWLIHDQGVHGGIWTVVLLPQGVFIGMSVIRYTTQPITWWEEFEVNVLGRG
jgi:hypothetical protein